ncbi:hypothetical protein BpKM390_13530 [Burkholderia pseudomallei]|nr:hypothetical protein GTC019_12890 [Burkholderia pseudomallei]BEH24166.1 hypothetical protein GTC050_14180 [Burkholderia pseudomallei]BEH30789.1 hypothetical protein GTC054_20050 [Burkholderia pseudomallei]BEH36246.1 hypothetical protein GTC254T_13410 [Burkholderia pseudomallei]BEH42190.1 hypothetical protein KNG_13910 [Burkholderia pseudomallei]
MHEPLRALDDEIVHVLQRHAVRRERPRIVAHLLLQPGHPDFEEFVEVAARDADEAQTLEEGDVRIGGLGEHALVEAQDAEFAIQERITEGHRQRIRKVRRRLERSLGNSHGAMTC